MINGHSVYLQLSSTLRPKLTTTGGITASAGLKVNVRAGYAPCSVRCTLRAPQLYTVLGPSVRRTVVHPGRHTRAGYQGWYTHHTTRDGMYTLLQQPVGVIASLPFMYSSRWCHRLVNAALMHGEGTSPRYCPLMNGEMSSPRYCLSLDEREGVIASLLSL